MVQKEINYVGFEKLVDFDAYQDLIHARAESSESGRVNRQKKRSEKDDDLENNIDYSSEEENDPQYELFLKSLKEDEKSYALEVKKSCLAVVIKYEGDTSSDEECDPEPRRKLRSATKQKNGPSRQPRVQNPCKDDSPSTSTKEAKNLNRRKSRIKAESEKVENVTGSNDNIVPDPDYLIFHQTAKVVDDHYVYTYGGHTIVYEQTYGENNQEQEGHADESSSDVEILDSNLRLCSPTMASEFRHQVIAVLRKPYDEEECDKLWLEIELRKPEERHLDLRHGRERAYEKRKDGKSYLDHHPDLEMRLLQFQDDKPKCLNLTRMDHSNLGKMQNASLSTQNLVKTSYPDTAHIWI
ncbi:hypothetical protein Sango_2340400 [Sesamum angolense]|uniref:Uncharacterized protein n=1 Tax=Sesamum angolense TaxID=2727404 RepID=A0AAE1W5U2_9LAMI|nr:hypothetical protein Sango_2340400 [Sesamum angolense]